MKKTLIKTGIAVFALMLVLSSCLGSTGGETTNTGYAYITESTTSSGMPVRYAMTPGGTAFTSEAVRNMDIGKFCILTYTIKHSNVYVDNIFAAESVKEENELDKTWLKTEAIPTDMGKTIYPTGVVVDFADNIGYMGSNFMVTIHFEVDKPKEKTNKEILEKIKPQIYYDLGKQFDQWEKEASVGKKIESYQGVLDVFLKDERAEEDKVGEKVKLYIQRVISLRDLRSYMEHGVQSGENASKPQTDENGMMTLPFKIRYEAEKSNKDGDIINPEGKRYIGDWKDVNGKAPYLYFYYREDTEER